MRKKNVKSDLVCRNVYLNRKDWEATKVLARKFSLCGADLVRAWMREGLEKASKNNPPDK